MDHISVQREKPARIRPDKILIRLYMECIQVKDEDADWRIYHAIPPDTPTSVETLTSTCGLAPGIVEASLARLERYCLISRTGTEVRVLSFGEALINNQIQYDKDLPYTIENGVIRARRK